MAWVPEGHGKDKEGNTFDYGGYEVTLQECHVCHSLYANALQHNITDEHKRLAAVSK